jgi:excisionase family DNA binding protein
MKTKSTECLDGFLTVEEASEIARFSLQGIRKAIKEGRIKAERKGRYWLIYRHDFERFMKEKNGQQENQ